MSTSTTVISSSLEDYLEAIAELVETNQHAHTKDLADKLHVSQASVTSALQNLAAKGMIHYTPNTPVTLTIAGAGRAAVIRNRHKAMKIFFAKVLKLDEQDANDTACKIEHVIGEKVLSRFVFLAEAIINRDDCKDFRNFLNDSMPKLCPEFTDDLIPLQDLPDGCQAIVVSVSDDFPAVRRLADLGLVRGTLVKMENRSQNGSQLNIQVMFSSLSLPAKDARHILVKIPD